MKKKHPILGVICLAILICGGIFTFRAGGAKAEITIGEKTYEMRTMTVREFMEDGYILAIMSTEGNSVYTYNYSGAVMEAKTYYNTAVGGSSFDLSEENARAIQQILDAGSWVPDATDCASDYMLTFDDRTIYYHSDCGTFNEQLEQSDQSLRLSDAERETVNRIIQAVIPHDLIPNAPIEISDVFQMEHKMGSCRGESMNTVYEEYRASPIDKGLLCLEHGEITTPYFCYPVNAEPIGFEGCIMYCFLPEYGEMVFACNPESCADQNVYPLAANFEDFIRLILACGTANPVEQIVWMDKSKFEEHMANEEKVLTDEQKAAVQQLQRELDLLPMEDPFEYVKAIQKDFDGSKVQYSDDYFEVTGIENPKGTATPDQPLFEFEPVTIEVHKNSGAEKP